MISSLPSQVLGRACSTTHSDAARRRRFPCICHVDIDLLKGFVRRGGSHLRCVLVPHPPPITTGLRWSIGLAAISRCVPVPAITRAYSTSSLALLVRIKSWDGVFCSASPRVSNFRVARGLVLAVMEYASEVQELMSLPIDSFSHLYFTKVRPQSHPATCNSRVINILFF